MTPDYVDALKDYPTYMSLEQMRIACHISKNTARRLLQTGLVPCETTGKKTHAYRVRKTHVICYLRERDVAPEKYRLGRDDYTRAYEKSVMDIEDADDGVSLSEDASLFDEYPDVLTTKQAAQIAGVACGAINDWANKKYLVSFRKSGVLYVPKLSLVEYLKSHRHRFNSAWKQWQFAKAPKP